MSQEIDQDSTQKTGKSSKTTITILPLILNAQFTFEKSAPMPGIEPDADGSLLKKSSPTPEIEPARWPHSLLKKSVPAPGIELLSWPFNRANNLCLSIWARPVLKLKVLSLVASESSLFGPFFGHISSKR